MSHEEILEQMIEELEDITFGRHTCVVQDQLVEIVNQARARLERLRLGIGAVAA